MSAPSQTTPTIGTDEQNKGGALQTWNDFLNAKGGKLFWILLLLLSLTVTIYRYREPMDIYSKTGDDAWGYNHSRPNNAIWSIIGSHGPRPLNYLLLYLLQTRTPNRGFMPDMFPMFGYPYHDRMRYMIFGMGAAMFWLIPVTGWVAYRLTRNRSAGLLVGLLLGISPYHNLIATSLQPQAFQVFFIALLLMQVYVVDRDKEGRELVKAGLLTGLMATCTAFFNYHGWFLNIMLFPAMILERVFLASREQPGGFWAGLPKGFMQYLPYGSAIIAGMLIPIALVESIFWINKLGGGWLYEVHQGFYSYLTASFSLGGMMKGGAWTYSNISGRFLGFVRVLFEQFGWVGTIMLASGVFWGLARPFLVKRKGLPFSFALVVLLVFGLFVSPKFLALGRMTMVIEFSAYVLLVQMLLDIFRAANRMKLFYWPAMFLVGIMISHMTFCSLVTLDDMLGFGRAARWLQEHPAKVYWARSPYAGGPSLSVEQFKKLPPDSKGWLLAIVYLPQKWQDLLKKVYPLRVWRTAESGWLSFHGVGGAAPPQSNYYYNRIAIFSVQDVLKAARAEKAAKPAAK